MMNVFPSVRRTTARRMTTALLAAALAVSCAAPAGAAETIDSGVKSSYDEAYYATLDYYGNLTDGSVVKSYTLNGAATLTDYGAYDEVINLTDGTVPTTTEGKTTFRFDEKTPPDRFYFEGKTQQPFEALPWTLSLRYALNGVPAKAEDLAGQTGVVEITLNAVPNPAASTYAKNNYTLEAAAVFNADDILSLEAPGAQVQLIGNLRLVLFLALPGEEQHFTIRVGADDFRFDGMTFLMLPATLSQLSAVGELQDSKDELEENYDKLSGSLDTLLDAMNGMSGSLRATAGGLEELNTARGTISQGKDQLYTDLDLALTDLDGMKTALDPVAQHLETASKALTDINAQINKLCGIAVNLKNDLSDLREVLDDLRTDLDRLQSGSGSLNDLRNDLGTLSNSLAALQGSANSMRTALDAMSQQAGSLTGGSEITVNGMTVSQIQNAVAQAEGAYSQYQGYLSTLDPTAPQPSFAEFLVGAGKTQSEAAQIAGLWAQAQTPEFAAQIQQAEAVNELLTAFNMTVDQMKALVRVAGPSTSTVLSQTAALCSALGNSGLSGSLSDLLKNADGSLDHLRDGIQVADSAAQMLKELLTQVDTLNTTVNQYIPDAQKALSDGKDLAASAASGLNSLKTFLSDLEGLAKTSGTQLDSGTKKTLEGLAASLRKAANSLSATQDVKAAKDNISGIIEDKWTEYTGEKSNLLNMDPEATPVSLTSEQNAAPNSVQILLRSQEIKAEEPAEKKVAAAAADKGTFWSRIAQMFRDFWSTITGVF